MQVDINSADQVIKDAETVFLTPKAEMTLTELLSLKQKLISLQQKIDISISQAKQSAEKILEAIRQAEVK